MDTKFASAEVSTDSELKQQIEMINSSDLFITAINAVPDAIMILNENRQTIFANRSTLKILELTDDSSIVGERPGNIFNCIHSEKVSGCGTTENCVNCGAVNSILQSQKGRTSLEECRLTQKDTMNCLDIRVQSAPVQISRTPMTVLTIMDISNEKRKKVLERVFFHDILNTMTILQGYLEVMKMDLTPGIQQSVESLSFFTKMLTDEISSQKMLIQAENNELQVDLHRIDAHEILNSLVEGYSRNKISKGKSIILDFGKATHFVSDKVLFTRVLGNAVKNALEASENGDKITVSCCKICEKNKSVRFSVHNPAVMPKNVRQQLFQRSFSTKGTGRGIGTYSMKMFTEKYLGGKVKFNSKKGEGTTFCFEFPLEYTTALS